MWVIFMLSNSTTQEFIWSRVSDDLGNFLIVSDRELSGFPGKLFSYYSRENSIWARENCFVEGMLTFKSC